MIQKNNNSFFIGFRLVIFFSLLFTFFQSKAQVAGNGIFFQAIARDNYSNPAKDRAVYVESSIIQYTATGTKVLTELHKTTTDGSGVFTISVGNGQRISGLVNTLDKIEWAKGPYYLGLKIAIQPISPVQNWDYTKELIDLGASPFGTVPYALYSGSSGALDDKLSITDTAKMLAFYAKSQTVNSLASTIGTKISSTDTAAMLAPYRQVVSALVASNITSLTAASVNAALNSKVNVLDSGVIYVTPAQLASKTFDSTAIYNQLSQKANTNDVNTSLALKANLTDVTTGLNNKENSSNKTIDVAADGTSDSKYPTAKAVKAYVDGQVSGATISNNAVTTAKISDGAVTDVKISSVSGSKISGDISGKASNITGNLAIVNGGTGATTASAARSNLGLVIGTDVQAPLSFTLPLSKNGNSISVNQATSSVDGYLNAADFTSFNNKIDATQKAANNGVATLGNDGKIPSNQIPAISFQSANVVSSQSSMLALNTAVVGSIAIRTDVNKNYVLSATPASTLSNWLELSTPSSVTSVNGSAGPNVVLTTNDVAEGATNKYYTDARVRSAINANAPLSFNSSTGTISMTAATASSNGYLSSTDFTIFSNKQNTLSAGVDYLAPNGSAANLTSFPTFNQSTTGNAATASKLAATKNINGVAFDGSANITIAADANTLTGTTLANTVTGSNLTSVGTITSGIWSASTIAIAKGGTGATTATGALVNLGAESIINKSTATDLGSNNPSDILFPSQKAVKTYIDLQSANAGVADGSITNAKLAGSITANKLIGTDISTVGTITSGTWSGTAINFSKLNISKANITSLGIQETLTAAQAGVLSNTSGTNTGDQTISLTGDVTGSGNGSFVTTVNSIGGVNSSTISGFDTRITSNTSSITTINSSLSAKADLASPTFTGTVSGITKSMVGLSNVENTALSTWAGSNNLSSIGTITSGTWSGTVIGSNLGGAGSVNGILKANGNGVVSAATAGTDFQTPITAAPTTGQFLTSAAGGTYTWTAASSVTGVPYTGATGTVNLGAYDLMVNGLTVGKGNGADATNTAIGAGALSSTTGLANTAVGAGALGKATSPNSNTAIGSYALRDVTTGGSNTAIGSYASSKITTGIQNIAIGYSALDNVTANSNNTAIGFESIRYNSGTNNTALGANSLTGPSSPIASGSDNTAIGKDALKSANTAAKNTALGSGSLLNLTTGNENTAIGYNAGSLYGSGVGANLTNLRQGILIGGGARALFNNSLNEIAIGYGTIGNGSNTVTVGNLSNTATYFTGDINLTGNINGGTWSGTVIGSNKGGAGSVNGLLKANGSGMVTAAVAGTDFMAANATTTLTGDVEGSGNGSIATTVNSIGGVNSSTISGFDTRITSNTSSITAINSSLSTKADLVSPTFTGTVSGISKSMVGLSNVENTTLSTWAGSNNLSSIGTITSGTWSGTVIGSNLGGAGSVNGILKANGNGVVSAATAGTDFQTPITAAPTTGQFLTSAAGGTYTWTAATSVTGVPYTGATGSVDLGAYDIYAKSAKFIGDIYTTPPSPPSASYAYDNTNYENNNGLVIHTYNQSGFPSLVSFVATGKKSGNFSSSINFSTRPSGANAVPLERLRITNDGKIGIGTTAPTTTLDVVGGGKISTDLFIGGAITSGTWSGTVIGSNYGGAGSVNGLLKANGSGMVTPAVAGTDFMAANSTTTLTGDVTGIGSGSFATTVNSVGGVNSSTISGFDTRITSNTSSITTINSSLSAKADLASPTFTGTVNGITKSMVGLSNVENTALSTWTGSNNLSSIGTITSGTWSGTAIEFNKLNISKANITSLGIQETLTAAQAGVLSNTTGVNTGDQTITLTGDVTGTGTGTFTSTLANTGVTAATYGSSTTIPSITVDAKGRITSATNTTFTAVSSLGTFTTTSYAAGGTISGTALILSAADATNPGLVSTGLQTFVGSKTFSSTSSANAGTGSSNLGTAKGLIVNPSLKSNGAWTELVAVDITPSFNFNGSANSAYPVGLRVQGANIVATGAGNDPSNTAIGVQSLRNNTTTSAGNNTAVGYNALTSTITGTANTSIGTNTLLYSQSGSNNTAVGYNALTYNKANNNTAIGNYALYSAVSANDNIGIGKSAGSNYGSINSNAYTAASGEKNILIGTDVRPLTNTDSYEIVIGSTSSGTGTIGDGTNTTTLGAPNTTSVKLYGAIWRNNDAVARQYTEAKDLTIEGQDANVIGYGGGANNHGGHINLTPGQATGTEVGGSINLNVGSGTTSGTVNINGQIKITGGTPGLGKVLTSNASGLATWATASSGVSTLTYTTASSNANGATISGTTLTLSAADATNPGLVSTGVQTFAGAKTFTNTVTFKNIAFSDFYNIPINGGFAGNTGQYNIGLGWSVLNNSNTGNNNIGLGYYALNANTSGANNHAIGYNALALNTTGNNNVAIGASALNNNTEGSYNTIIGHTSLNANTTGNRNTVLGANVLSLNTTNGDNTAVGYYALHKSTGGYNDAFGSSSLGSTTTGTGNVAFGSGTSSSNTTGNYNTAIGGGALGNATTSPDNVAVGNSAGSSLTTDATNTGGSVFIGKDAGRQYGYSGAGGQHTTGYNNILIGKDARSLGNGDYNEIVISPYNMNNYYGGTSVSGLGGIGGGSNTTTIGNTSTTNAVIYGSASLSNFPATATLVGGATGANGEDFVLKAQSATGAYGNGGNIVLTPGNAISGSNNGVVKVNGSVQITGGTPGLGKVLTSDANGVGTWIAPVGVSSLGAFSSTSNAKGGVINGTTLTLTAADETNPGLISTAAQTIVGSKTFSSTTTSFNGQVKIVDGTQAVNKVLTSDANGLATWANPLPSGQFGTLANSSNHQSISLTGNGSTTNTYLNSYITLPVGKWDVYLNILTSATGTTTAGTWWVRMGLSTSNSSLINNTTDFPINTLLSGRVTATGFDMIQGHIIINNTSGSAKSYYLWTAGCDLSGANGSSTLEKISSSTFGENLIFALPMY